MNHESGQLSPRENARNGGLERDTLEESEAAPLPDYVNMYEVPGADEITPHTWARYHRAKKRYSEKIQDLSEILIITSRIRFAPETERTSLVQHGLTSMYPEVQKIAAQMIPFAPEADRASLMRQGLASTNPDVQTITAQMIDSVPSNALASLSILIKEIVKQALSGDDLERLKVIAPMINCAPNGDQVPLMKQGLASTNPDVQTIAASMVHFVEVAHRASCRILVKNIVEQGLASGDPERQQLAVSMIEFVPGEDWASLIEQGLASGDPEVQKIAASKTAKLTHGVELVPLRMHVRNLIEQGLASGDPERQQLAVGLVNYAPVESRASLTQKMIELGLGPDLIKPPLYNNSISNERLSRHKFTKTGSETIVVGGALKDKAIIRRIKPTAFLVWQKIFEDFEVWRNAGFDYVPVEPILSFAPNKDGLIDVQSGVLDLNLESWANKTDMFNDELYEQRNKIFKVLKNMNVTHGHFHDKNLCLRFFRDANGEPDFTTVPRLYLIDFDDAKTN